MENVIKELAAYFTGPAVAAHSMGLSGSASNALAAELFFKAREALGIRGYAKPQEAENEIRRAFGLTTT